METVEDDARYSKLRRFNALMGLFHFLQGSLMVLISNSVALPIKSNFLYFDEISRTISTRTETLFELPIGLAVAAFLFAQPHALAWMFNSPALAVHAHVLAGGLTEGSLV